MKRYFHCAEQQESPSNITEYCACRTWLSWLILVTHETGTSSTMRRATGVTFQYHQTLCVPHKWHAKISGKFSENGWNVMCNAGPIRSWSEHDPFSPQPAAQLRFFFAFSKIQHFALRLPFRISPNIAPATKSDSWTSPNIAPANVTECATWVQLHQMLRLPRKVNAKLECSLFSLLFFDSTIYSFARWFLSLLPFFDSIILWIYFFLLYHTLPFFDSTTLLLDDPLSLLFFYSTSLLALLYILLLYYSCILVFFDCTILWLYYSLSLLFFYSTILWPYHSLTLLLFCAMILWTFCLLFYFTILVL